MRRPELLFAKAMVVLGGAALVTVAYYRTGTAQEADVPVWAIGAGALFLTAGAAALYEALGYGLAWLLSRTRRGVGPPPPPGGLRSTAIGPEVIDEETFDADADGEAPSAERRAFGIAGALITFGAYLAGMAVVWVTFGIWVGLVGGVGRDFETALVEQASGWFVVAAAAGAGAAVLAFRRLSSMPMRDMPGVVGLGDARAIALGVAVGAAANALYLQTVPLLPVDPPRMPDSALWTLLLEDGPARWVVLVTAVVVAPVAEELVFRGIIFEGFANTWGPVGAVLSSSALFTLLHIPDTAHFWPAAVMIFVMGSVAGLFRARTGRIGPCVGVHFGHNLVVALLWAL